MILPIPYEWTQPMPEDAVARLIAGVRSHIGQSVTEDEVQRRREAEGADFPEDDA